MLHNVFDEYPGFKFFSAEDVLKVRSLGLPKSTYDWENEHFELVSGVLGVSTEFMYERLKEAFEGGSAGWGIYCEWGDGLSLAELEDKGLPRAEVMRLYEEGCLNGGIWEGALLFTRAQFWGGAGKGVWSVSGEGALRFNPEFFECVRHLGLLVWSLMLLMIFCLRRRLSMGFCRRLSCCCRVMRRWLLLRWRMRVSVR